MISYIQNWQYNDGISKWKFFQWEGVVILGRSPRYVVTTIYQHSFENFAAKPYFWSLLQNQKYFDQICCKSPNFGHSYRAGNILTRFCCKSPTFGHSYRTRNILTRFCCKSPTFSHSYRTRNILTRFCCKSFTFGHFNRTRIILTRFCWKSPTSGHSYRTKTIQA